jgi:transcriptional regulator with XRE-family HTH domain
MKKATNPKFGVWLDGECKKRGWSHGELGRRAGVSEARVSQICRGFEPGLRFLSSIAGPLEMSQYEVWQRAGVALPTKLDDPTRQELLEVFSVLSAPQKRLVIRIIRALRDDK